MWKQRCFFAEVEMKVRMVLVKAVGCGAWLVGFAQALIEAFEN
jgi:hypothetical protein